LRILFLPKNAVSPYQVVVVFGGSTIMQEKRVARLRISL
jgi:hypothetical protein